MESNSSGLKKNNIFIDTSDFMVLSKLASKSCGLWIIELVVHLYPQDPSKHLYPMNNNESAVTKKLGSKSRIKVYVTVKLHLPCKCISEQIHPCFTWEYV